MQWDHRYSTRHGQETNKHPWSYPSFAHPLTQWCSQWCNRSLANGGRMNRASHKDILRYVLDSGECKIDSAKAQNLKTLVEHLCTTVNDEFMKYYLMVETQFSQIKKMFKKMYKYCAQTMANYVKEMDQDAVYNNLILWQVPAWFIA